MVGALSDREIRDLLAASRYGHPGCHYDGLTYVVPINFVVDGSRLLPVTSAGRKIDIMRSNPKVCVQVEDVESIDHWKSVILWGKFRVLEGIERADAMGKLIDHQLLFLKGENCKGRQG
jgi:nitroimidazol reductase NimA-like FMN-containing flavoprotein (pyridoxamine 5'-phosphate oxidase superfamily)